MRKQGLKSMEAKIEREYMLPLVDVVRGYLEDDGATPRFAADILGVRESELLDFCRQKGIRLGARARVAKVQPRVSPTRAAWVSKYRRRTDRISYVRLADITGMSKWTIRARYESSGDLRRALVASDLRRRA